MCVWGGFGGGQREGESVCGYTVRSCVCDKGKRVGVEEIKREMGIREKEERKGR